MGSKGREHLDICNFRIALFFFMSIDTFFFKFVLNILKICFIYRFEYLKVKRFCYVYDSTAGYLLSCGSDKEVESNKLKYKPDDEFVAVGKRAAIPQPNILPLLTSARYFPNPAAKKYCYTFPVYKGGKFLVKTLYYYGGFDGGKEPPVFDQIIDGTKWNVVNTTEDYSQGLSSYYEVIIMAHGKTLSVCLARNMHTTSSPFISAIEVHSLDDSVYNSTDFKKHALITVARHSFANAGEVIG